MSFSTPAARTVAAGILTLATSLGVAGCGSDTSSASDTSSTKSTSSKAPSADASAQKLDVAIKGETITPTNKRIEVNKGKPLTITISSDRPGELHVHSSPEEEIPFDKGTTTKQVTFANPGVVEVEEHVSDTLIAQLEVR
jgi:hypothetical protein